MNMDDRLELLEVMKSIIHGDAAAESEDNSLKSFLPLNSYQKVIDPTNILIVGDRGTGKTRLFRTLNQKDGYRFIYDSVSNRSKLPEPDKIDFLVGFTECDSGYPSRSMCDQFLTTRQISEIFWSGCACFMVYNNLRNDETMLEMADQFFTEPFLSLLKDERKIKDVNEWLPAFAKEAWRGENYLDEVDEYLRRKKRYLTITYDGLDMITSSYQTMFPVIYGLLNFWSVHKRRWHHLFSKIFLRKDIIENPSVNEFVDSSKLRAVTLSWTKSFLYQLLIKRFVNSDSNLAYDYTATIAEDMLRAIPGDLGYLPSGKEENHMLFVEKLIGQYMGKVPKRGVSYNWVPNHIQDANGQIAPRSFLKCFSAAAEIMLENEDELAKADFDRLLTPGAIQSAMYSVSEDRVSEICESYIWLRTLKSMLSGAQLLMSESMLLDRIDMEQWTGDERRQLPSDEKRGILNFLIDIGVMYYNPDGRINVPEIYMHGFGMVRKGGIRSSK